MDYNLMHAALMEVGLCALRHHDLKCRTTMDLLGVWCLDIANMLQLEYVLTFIPNNIKNRWVTLMNTLFQGRMNCHDALKLFWDHATVQMYRDHATPEVMGDVREVNWLLTPTPAPTADHRRRRRGDR